MYAVIEMQSRAIVAPVICVCGLCSSNMTRRHFCLIGLFLPTGNHYSFSKKTLVNMF
uniref:Uncharacterized protein n=1 Tax=Anguilla anguilla TaxID=7936 RepID=A0A0E9QJ11_ANGAN